MIEQLESRRLMSVTLNDGLLCIEGTNKSDEIIVARKGDTLFVKFNCDVSTFDYGDVEKIKVFAGNGKDLVAIGPEWGCFEPICVETCLFGENGKDTIIGGDGNDFIDGGNGKDLLIGNKGCDVIKGENAPDILCGGCDWDKLFGGRGPDKLFGGPGNDLLVGGSAPDYLNGGPGFDITIQ